MNKVKLKIVDRAFAHCGYSNNPLPPTSFSPYVEWDRKVGPNEDVVFYTDSSVRNTQPGHRVKIAWLIEPYVKQPGTYEWLRNNNHLYDYVLTNEKTLLDKGENFVFFPFGGCWIESENRRVDHTKTELVSIIASGKRNVPAHLLRHQIVERHSDIIDVMGRGYKTIEPISVGLKDYMFHIAMENQNRDYHFSEKIINPMMTGTIPIYYGPPCIGDYFDTRGMILFNDIDEIPEILGNLNKKLYISMKSYIQTNFEMAKEYTLSEDWMWKHGVIDKLTL
jgi:hypothetical protein|tara:strand:+ start:702 stop:1538 length:837 start_codon:yes stop_codon:yes gene_type:complete